MSNTFKTPLSVLGLFLALILILLDFAPLMKGRTVEASTPVVNQGQELLAFLGLNDQQIVTVTAQPGEVISLPDISYLPSTLDAMKKDVSDIVGISLAYNANPGATSPLLYVPQNGYIPYNFSSQVLPLPGSPLYYAYRQGGSIFYEENDNVVLIFPDKTTFKSYFKSTGFESTFLQDTLSYPPIDTPDAINKYRQEYGGMIVAQTDTWVLMKFPSGGFLKIAKPAGS
jgi:hypothetical protein